MDEEYKLEYKYYHWGPFVMQTKITEELRLWMLDEARKQQENFNKELAGHLKYQFKYTDEVAGQFYEKTQPIFKMYRQGHVDFHGSKGKEVRYVGRSLWVNFMKPGDWNPPHIHGGDFSFVVYLDVPDELRKEFKEFEGTSAGPGSITFDYGTESRPKWATNAHHHYPESGDMIIFPALTAHSVAPFKTDCTRISVSGNLTYELNDNNNLDRIDDYF
jgi:hypothetical protein